jgi:hypothetical protein
MTAIAAILRNVLHLFVDDGSLALAVIGVVAISAGLAAMVPDRLIAGTMLAGGCMVVLVANVVISARR